MQWSLADSARSCFPLFYRHVYFQSPELLRTGQQLRSQLSDRSTSEPDRRPLELCVQSSGFPVAASPFYAYMALKAVCAPSLLSFGEIRSTLP